MPSEQAEQDSKRTQTVTLCAQLELWSAEQGHWKAM